MPDAQPNPDPLSIILNPRSIVVAGASSNPMKMGSIQTVNLMTSGYTGEILLIHPKGGKLFGRTAYTTPDDLPFAPDLAMLVTPSRVTVELLRGLGRLGVKQAVIISAGFKEVGGQGIEMERELVEIAQEYGIRFMGPNCLGIINPWIGLNLTVFPYRDRPGKLGLISQSGTYVAQLMPYLRERGIRYGTAISVGNAADIDLVDCLDYLGRDPHIGAIALYIEGIRRGREFVECARLVAQTKPIVALYVGGSQAGARSSLSHTGSLGGPDRLMDGLLEQAGILRAATLEELFGWSHALASMPVPRGKRMAILTHSGGPATSMADACEKAGLEVPVLSPALQEQIQPLIEPHASAKNPIDLTFTLEHSSFSKEIPRLLFPSEEIDGVLVHGLMDTGIITEIHPAFKNLVNIPIEMVKKAVELDLDTLIDLPHQTGKPMVASNFFREDHGAQTLRDHDIPLFATPEQAVGAMAALVRYGETRKRLASGERDETDGCLTQRPGYQDGATGMKAQLSGTLMDAPSDGNLEPTRERPVARVVFDSAQEAENLDTFTHGAPSGLPDRLPAGVLDEFSAKSLLARFGIPVCRERKVQSLDEAFLAAGEIGYPVVLKGLPQGVAHKSEAGLVQLHIRSDTDLERAWDRIEAAAPGCPRLVAEMLKGERELVVGMTRFPGFGPCVMVGIGGIFTEAIADATFRLAPVPWSEALRMPDSLRLGRLFEAHRGLPAVDRTLLAQTIQAVGRLALEHPEIAEIDINPLIVVEGTPIAADALVVVKPGL
ncbi:MAG: acetate--CoA ligase family protein [Bradymonadales bacterium]|nr:acetate--CoA ligase family protein [Bradymonadales bacterium]